MPYRAGEGGIEVIYEEIVITIGRSRLEGHTDHANTIYSIRHEKTANNGRFLVKS